MIRGKCDDEPYTNNSSPSDDEELIRPGKPIVSVEKDDISKHNIIP